MARSTTLLLQRFPMWTDVRSAVPNRPNQRHKGSYGKALPRNMRAGSEECVVTVPKDEPLRTLAERDLLQRTWAGPLAGSWVGKLEI